MNIAEARVCLPFSAVAIVWVETVSCQSNDFLAAKLYVFPRIYVQI
jgi:hypothetical protein